MALFRRNIEQAIMAVPPSNRDEILDFRNYNPANPKTELVETFSTSVDPNSDLMSSSFKGPISFLSIAHIGWVLFNKNFYPSHYQARQRVFAGRSAIKPTMADLVHKQPWFRWDSSAQKYELIVGGATDQLMNTVFENANSDTITLYRGTTEQELTLMRKVIEKDPDSIAELKKRLEHPDDYGAYFFTPSLDEAKGFGKGTIVQIQLSRVFVQQLLSTASIYAGLENTRIEVAFFDYNTLLMIAPLYQAVTIMPEK
ncbi:MAG: hypothetical protein ACXVCP_04680 [Bdellovibrio sp.]